MVHPWLSPCGKHTRQKQASPRRAGACLTSLIGFFRARSQGDEKLYQAEIINFVVAALESADTSLLSENEEGEGNDIFPSLHLQPSAHSPFPPPFFGLDSVPSITFFYYFLSRLHGGDILADVKPGFVLKYN